MKNNLLFGLLALGLLAGMSFALPDDYNLFVKTGGCLRYIGPEVMPPYFVFPQAHPDEYREVEFSFSIYPSGAVQEVASCPRENGIPTCH